MSKEKTLIDKGKTLPLRKVIRTAVYYCLPISLALIAIISPSEHLFLEIGEHAVRALIVVMFIKPIAVLFPNKYLRPLLTYRREMGLLAFWLFLFHGAGMIYWQSLYNPADYLGFKNNLFWGAIAGVGMLVLGMTSNNYSVRKLKRNWRRVHYVAYPVFVAALIHVALVDDPLLYGGLAVAFPILKVCEWYKRRNEIKKRKASVNKEPEE